MARKGFCVNVRLELHAITCPGVWLCPNGKVALRITTLGSTLESHRVPPIFPLLFHNEFTFKKTFTRLAALTELQRNLEQEYLYAELIQWLCPCNQSILLATFEASLADVLYPAMPYERLLPGADVDLLMDPSRCYPVSIPLLARVRRRSRDPVQCKLFSRAGHHSAQDRSVHENGDRGGDHRLRRDLASRARRQSQNDRLEAEILRAQSAASQGNHQAKESVPQSSKISRRAKGQRRPRVPG